MAFMNRTTPPPNGILLTNVVGFSEELIRDAISYEIQRNGQVFLSIIESKT
jgi:transcription-repair coupling factor (superfamily II helicase)